jgi:hypothetical protein
MFFCVAATPSTGSRRIGAPASARRCAAPTETYAMPCGFSTIERTRAEIFSGDGLRLDVLVRDVEEMVKSSTRRSRAAQLITAGGASEPPTIFQSRSFPYTSRSTLPIA